MEEFFKDKKGFWAILFYEFMCMFSNKPSFFASKRFERFFMFIVAMYIINGYAIRNWYGMTTTDVSVLTGILLFGSAWNATQIRKDQQMKSPVATGSSDGNLV